MEIIHVCVHQPTAIYSNYSIHISYSRNMRRTNTVYQLFRIDFFHWEMFIFREIFMKFREPRFLGERWDCYFVKIMQSFNVRWVYKWYLVNFSFIKASQSFVRLTFLRANTYTFSLSLKDWISRALLWYLESNVEPKLLFSCAYWNHSVHRCCVQRWIA